MRTNRARCDRFAACGAAPQEILNAIDPRGVMIVFMAMTFLALPGLAASHTLSAVTYSAVS